MKMKTYGFLVFAIFFVVTLTLSIFAKEAACKKYGSAFGIDYDKPDKYLKSGMTSSIDQKYESEIRKEIGAEGKTLDTIKAIFLWKKRDFKTEHARGRLLGKRSVNELLKSRNLSGCNDHGLLLVSVLRMYGFPAVLVNAGSIKWAKNYTSGKKGGFYGHTFAEIYIDGKWSLANSTTGEYIADYDPTNPKIPISSRVEPVGYYAYHKGIDLASSGIHDMSGTRKLMEATAPTMAKAGSNMPKYKIENLLPMRKGNEER